MGCCISAPGGNSAAANSPAKTTKHVNHGFNENEETNKYDDEEYEPPKKQKVSVALWIDAYNNHLNNGTLEILSSANFGPLGSGSFSAAPTNLSMTSSAAATVSGVGGAAGGPAVLTSRSYEFTAVGSLVVPASRKSSNSTGGDLPADISAAAVGAQGHHRGSGGGSTGAGAVAAQVLSASALGANLLAAAATDYVRTQFGALAVVNPQRPVLLPQQLVLVGEGGGGSMTSSANRVSYHSSNAATRGAGGTSRASTPRPAVVNPFAAGSWRAGDDADGSEDCDVYGGGGGGGAADRMSPLFGNTGGLPRSPRVEYLEGASLRGSLRSQRSNNTNCLAVDEMLRLRTVRPTSSNPASAVAGGPCVELDRRREEFEDFGDEEYQQTGTWSSGKKASSKGESTTKSIGADEGPLLQSSEHREANPQRLDHSGSPDIQPQQSSEEEEDVVDDKDDESEEYDDDDKDDEVTKKWNQQLRRPAANDTGGGHVRKQQGKKWDNKPSF
jgi:hypothetical protein